MEIDELQQTLEDIRPEDESASNGLEILTAKLGQMAMGRIKIEAADEPDGEDRYRRDMVAGLVVAAAEYCQEHDIDLTKALEERLDAMEEAAERRDKRKQAIEDGDAEALAEALGADANEVPTGDDEDDDAPSRGVY